MVNGLAATAAAAPSTFTVKIPETIPLTSEQGSFEIKASGSGTEDTPVTVTVTSSGAFKLQAADMQAELPYTLYRDAYKSAITNAEPTVAVLSSSQPSASIYYKIDKPLYAGNYADTLTFTITPN